jgi:hypothetical protein
VSDPPRIAVLIPCHNEGSHLLEAVDSVQEEEPVDITVIDDASTDGATLGFLDVLEGRGVKVLRLAENVGVGRARMAGLAATHSPYVFPLDGDDLAIPGVLAQMADRLDADRSLGAVVGDVQEFGDHELLRAVPERLDPYRVAFTNEYPISALFRRSVLEELGGWFRARPKAQGYEDWNLWMSLAERGVRIAHLGAGRPGYRRRLHGLRMNAEAKSRHALMYGAMRDGHPELFSRLREHRRNSDLGPLRKVLYPLLYGSRAELPFERRLKPLADRFGVWTWVRRPSRVRR